MGFVQKDDKLMEKNRYKMRKRSGLVGKIIALLQLLASAVFVFLLYDSGMFPVRYVTLAGLGLLLVFLIVMLLQCLRKSVFHWIGILISILVIVLVAAAGVYFQKANRTLDDVGGAQYKTDNMVVVVREEDEAQELQDALGYRFGSQTQVDQDNTQKMLQDIETTMGEAPELTEYASVQEEAQALLDGEIDAAVYNEAFTSVLEESIEGYSDKVRVLYQYGIDTELAKEEKSIEEPFNVYISGIDVSGAITTNSRSDVNIIMTVNPKTKKILLTTTPRDYYVEVPGISGGAKDKLTHAGIYGVDASIATLEELYDINITYYARVNFTSLVKIVDVLGGVDVDSSYAFSAGGYQFTEGVNHLDGEKALAFSRERHSFADGDNQRGKNQEAVLTAILKKAMSPALLTNAGQLLDSVSDSVETNMTSDEMAGLINMQLADGSEWTVESEAATGTGDTQTCYSSGSAQLYVMHPDEASVADISEKIASVMREE